MQKNWYILYTKSECEKKVSSLLTKKRIKNFYPVNCKEIGFRRKKKTFVPLFTSYVFVNTTEDNLEQIKQMHHVINLVYWKKYAAIVSENEISLIKEFSNNYHNIKLISSSVVENDLVSYNDPLYLMQENVLLVRNKIMKMKVPSLGVIMVAEIGLDTSKARALWNMPMIMQ